MNQIIKYFLVKYYYKIKYPNSIIESYLGVNLSHLEPYVTIRHSVELSHSTKVGAFSLINKYCQAILTVESIGASNHNYNEFTSHGILDTIQKRLSIFTNLNKFLEI